LPYLQHSALRSIRCGVLLITFGRCLDFCEGWRRIYRRSGSKDSCELVATCSFWCHPRCGTYTCHPRKAVVSHTFVCMKLNVLNCTQVIYWNTRP
jgi:hypothetical protein